MNATPAGTVLVYDGDCGFCQATLDRMRASSLVLPPVVDGRRGDIASLGLSAEDVNRASWVITPQGRHEGADGFSVFLRRQPRPGWRLAGHLLALPGVRQLARIGYRLIARSRHRLPGGTAQCAIG